ncbi:MAG: RNA methyltransferase [Pseudomonadota bacterium]|nr:RNA methyltransferase [Pseudomonadota bacterium]
MNAPTIILIDPQLGENIGMVARAMLNCGLTELRMVRPRDRWPSPKAVRASAGADVVLDKTTLYKTTSDAIKDLNVVYAATARERNMTKMVATPSQVAKEICSSKGHCGVLFGGEANGLCNDDIAISDKIMKAPLNPQFSSLNLSQAVLLFAHEYWKLKDQTLPLHLKNRDSPPAKKIQLLALFEHLESALDQSGFLHIGEKRPIMVRNLRNLIQRSSPTEQEVRTLRGVITSLTRGKGKSN